MSLILGGESNTTQFRIILGSRLNRRLFHNHLRQTSTPLWPGVYTHDDSYPTLSGSKRFRVTINVRKGTPSEQHIMTNIFGPNGVMTSLGWDVKKVQDVLLGS